jgi:hypothetical protein
MAVLGDRPPARLFFLPFLTFIAQASNDAGRRNMLRKCQSHVVLVTKPGRNFFGQAYRGD